MDTLAALVGAALIPARIPKKATLRLRWKLHLNGVFRQPLKYNTGGHKGRPYKNRGFAAELRFTILCQGQTVL